MGRHQVVDGVARGQQVDLTAVEDPVGTRPRSGLEPEGLVGPRAREAESSPALDAHRAGRPSSHPVRAVGQRLDVPVLTGPARDGNPRLHRALPAVGAHDARLDRHPVTRRAGHLAGALTEGEELADGSSDPACHRHRTACHAEEDGSHDEGSDRQEARVLERGGASLPRAVKRSHRRPLRCGPSTSPRHARVGWQLPSRTGFSVSQEAATGLGPVVPNVKVRATAMRSSPRALLDSDACLVPAAAPVAPPPSA